MKKLPREFYERTSLEISKELLGKFLVHIVGGEKIIGKIVEVEAYMGPEDKAAHSYNNRRTERTEVMFGPPGHAYVYFIYGKNFCMNVVCEEVGKPQAVLIRALEPVEGINTMARLRYGKSIDECARREVIGLTNGPGKACMALNITKVQNSGDLCGDELYITEGDKDEKFDIVTTTRINIDYAEEAVHYPWRFYIKDNKYISKK